MENYRRKNKLDRIGISISLTIHEGHYLASKASRIEINIGIKQE